MERNSQSEEALRQYLLGGLSPEEREAIERRYLADRTLLDEMLAVEDDLFDEYVSGELSRSDREEFESRLLATPKQLEKLQRARYLQQAMRARQLPITRADKKRTSIIDSWLDLFRPSKLPILAGALVLLLFVAAGVWLLIRSQRAQLPQNQELFAQEKSKNVPSPQASTPTPSPNVAKTVLALNDGGSQVLVDDLGNTSGLEGLSPVVGQAVKNALLNQRVNITPALENLKGKSGALMGTPGAGVPFALIGPVGSVMRSDRPTFRWRQLTGASNYVVKVFDTNFREVAASPPLDGLTWQAADPLSRGQIYIWQVTAIRGGEEINSPVPPAPEARFRVLSQDRVAQLAQVEKTHRNSHLALGVLYAESGLLQDAEREFKLLLKANPGSEVVQNLLSQVSK